MASIHRDPQGRSPFWYAAYTDSTGRRRFKSTKQRDRIKALEVCRGWDHAAQLGREGTLTEIQVRKVLGEIYEHTTGEKIQFETIKDYFDNWLKEKAKTTAPNTRRIYSDAVNLFVTHLGARSRLLLRSLDKRHFESFRDEQQDQGKSSKTLNLQMGVLRTAMEDAFRDQKVLSNVAKGVRPLPENSGERQRFTREQITALLKVADDEWKAVTLLGVYYGLRLGDAANLKRSDADFGDKKQISFFPQKQRRTLKKKKQVVPMLADVERVLLELPVKGRNPDAPLFPSLAGRPINGARGLSQGFVNLMEKAGIKRQAVTDAKGAGRKFYDLGFHSLRHTAISQHADSGMAEDVRKKVSGHSTSRVHAG